jgi:hypothetical protein
MISNYSILINKEEKLKMQEKIRIAKETNGFTEKYLKNQ